MELSLEVSIILFLAILFGCLWMLQELRECRKIINKMQKRSRKYIREVVSKDE